MSTAAIFTLASGGWLIVSANGERSILAPLPAMTGQPAEQLAQALRDWADDIERAAGTVPGSTEEEGSR